MLSRQFIFCIIVATLNCCQSNKKNQDASHFSQEAAPSSPDVNNIDRDFNSFIDRFSKDTTYQLGRTLFPLMVKQYDVINDRYTLIYKQRSEVEILDFRRKKQGAAYDDWKQEIIIDKSGAKATIEIRGTDNGIVVDYIFEKRNGRWMFVSVDDKST